MVVDSASPVQTDRVFRALADPTRRDIVRRTLVEPLSVSALAHTYPMSFAAVQKHVAVLKGAGLVGKTRRGREQLVAADPAALRRASAFLDQMATVWQGRIGRLGEILATDTKGAQP